MPFQICNYVAYLNLALKESINPWGIDRSGKSGRFNSGISNQEKI